MTNTSFRPRRVQMNCSQYEVSNRAGISRNRLSLIECNYIKATDSEVEKINAALNEIENEQLKIKAFLQKLGV